MNRQIRASQFFRLCRAWNTLSPAKRLYIHYLISTDRLRTRILPELVEMFHSVLIGTLAYWTMYTLTKGELVGFVFATPIVCAIVAFCSKK